MIIIKKKIINKKKALVFKYINNTFCEILI